MKRSERRRLKRAAYRSGATLRAAIEDVLDEALRHAPPSPGVLPAGAFPLRLVEHDGWTYPFEADGKLANRTTFALCNGNRIAEMAAAAMRSGVSRS